MPKLTNKQMSVEHEEFIANEFGGRRERASGASITAPGDVYVPDSAYNEKLLIECKVSESGSVSISRKAIHKIREEAATRGCRPMVALRLRDPYDPNYHVDVILKLIDDELTDLAELQQLRYLEDKTGGLTF